MLSQIEQVLLFLFFFCLMVGVGCLIEKRQYLNLIVTWVASLIPVAVGFVILFKSGRWALLTEKWGARIGYLSIGLMVLIWYSKIYEILQKQDLLVFVTPESEASRP